MPAKVPESEKDTVCTRDGYQPGPGMALPRAQQQIKAFPS